MISLYFFFALFVMAPESSGNIVKSVSFEEAISQGLIDYQVIHSSELPSGIIENDTYGSETFLTITSKSNTDLAITLSPGILFEPEDDEVQTLITTETLIVEVPKGQSHRTNFSAMCIHMHRHAPDEGTMYKFGEQAEAPLLGLVEIIEAMDLQDHTGQMAIWCLTDRQPLANIEGENAEATKKLQQYISDALDTPLPTEKSPKGIYLTNAQYNDMPVAQRPGQFTYYVNGYFQFYLSNTSDIGIVMTKPNGQLYKKLYDYDRQPGGMYTVKFDFADVFEEKGTYNIRLYINDRPVRKLQLVVDA